MIKIDKISYKKLFHLMLDRDIKNKDLQEQAGFTAPTMSKLKKDKVVTTDIITRICRALNVQPGDIMEYVPEVQENPVKSRLYWIAKYGENASMDDVFDEFNEEFPQKQGEDIFAYTQRKTSIFNEIFKSE